MAKRNDGKRSDPGGRGLLMAVLGFALKVLVAVVRKRGAGSGDARTPPAPREPRTRQKARKREGARAATAPKPKRTPRPRRGEHPITALQRAGATDHRVRGEAMVFRVLPDDLEGSKHQRFLVKLSDGHVVKISHNIDLAPRVPAGEGDVLRFAGDFESNERGGAVHWTHLDPRNRHPHGWIEHRGKRYE